MVTPQYYIIGCSCIGVQGNYNSHILAKKTTILTDGQVLMISFCLWLFSTKFPSTWTCRFVWPRDLCYVRYWRRNDDGSYGKLLGYNFSKPRLLFLMTPFWQCLHMQLCYFDLQNIQTVVGSEDMWGLLLKVIFLGPIISPASSFTRHSR